MNIGEQLLGQGHTSKVYSCNFEGKQCAAKVYNNATTLDQRKKEIQIMELCDHPNLVKAFSHCPNNQWIIMELLKGKDLFDFLAKSGKPFQMRSVRYMAKQMANALQYLHDKGIAHRDVKLENMLVDENFNIKVCDLGFAEFTNGQKVPRMVGTEGYLAPELQQPGNIHPSYLIPTDVFSLGVCLFTLVFAHPPFRAAKSSCPYWRVISRGDWKKFWQAVEKGNPRDQDFKDLIEKMLSPAVEARGTLNDVLNFGQGGCHQTFLQEMTERWNTMD